MFSHVCVPYAGIYQTQDDNGDSHDWWNGPTYSRWEIPSQTGSKTPLGINPSYARRFKMTMQSYNIHDHFQILQFPWPKGARDETEAYDRINCYLSLIGRAACVSMTEELTLGEVFNNHATLKDPIDFPPPGAPGPVGQRYNWLFGLGFENRICRHGQFAYRGLV